MERIPLSLAEYRDRLQEGSFPSKLIYLSADSENLLDDVSLRDPSVGFVIGGLVDRNRHKGASHRAALDLGIPTARLPIRESGIQLAASHVLTVINVVEILLAFRRSSEWRSALEACIPQRKLLQKD